MTKFLTKTVFILVYLPHMYADSWFTINNSVTQNIPQSSASETNAIPDAEDVPVLPSSDDINRRATETFTVSFTTDNEDILSSSFTDYNMSVAADSDAKQSALIASSDNITTSMTQVMILSKRSVVAKNQTIEDHSGFALPNVNYSLHRLMEECPDADICSRNTTPKSYSPGGQCCLSCSCDPRCKLIGNCCDKTIMGNDSMCHWPMVQVKDSNYGNAYQYFMVDKCLNSQNATDCKAIESGPWGSLFPVYDAASDHIFYNKHCAECNGVESYTHWNLNIICRTPYFANEYFLNALQGNALQGNKCEISFIPPRKVQLEKHLCSTSLISRCNVSGLWSMYDPWLEEACLRWFSPVPYFNGQLMFSNIYCQRCNGYTGNLQCNFGTGWRGNSFGSFELLIDYKKISTLTRGLIQNSKQHLLGGQCGKDMVKHPFKMECRNLLCPCGFIRIDGRCEPISTAWMYEQYFVQLEMTSAMNQLLPMSYLDSLSKEELSNPNIWFDSKGAPLDYFTLFVETSKNTSFVEKLIVRVGRITFPLNVAKEAKTIRKAISQVWEININRKAFNFTVNFDKYARYVYDGTRRVDVVKLVANETTVYEGKAVKRVNTIITNFDGNVLTQVLRKTNFCDRVRLLPTEWSGGYQEIRLNSSITGKNVERILGDSEFDIFLDDNDKVVVEVCVEDFNQDYKMHTTNAAFLIACNGHVMLLVLLILSD